MYLLLRISLTFWLGVYKGTSDSYSTSCHLPSIMSTSIQFTTGERGKENAITDGFRYSLDKRRTRATGVVNSYWRCVTPGCSGRLALLDDAISNSLSHNHGEQRAEITVHRANKLLKQRAATSDMTTKHIVASAVAGVAQRYSERMLLPSLKQ